jgi:LytS/YehU family sensor histidine kinase
LIEEKQEENSFSLYTLNTVEIQNNPDGNGIGLKNIKKRLRLLYPDSHLIRTNGTEGFFEVNLKLEFK